MGGGSQVPENPLGTLPRFLSVEKFIKAANINIFTTSSGNVNLTDKLALLCCLQGILGAAPLCEISCTRKLEQASVK